MTSRLMIVLCLAFAPFANAADPQPAPAPPTPAEIVDTFLFISNGFTPKVAPEAFANAKAEVDFQIQALQKDFAKVRWSGDCKRFQDVLSKTLDQTREELAATTNEAALQDLPDTEMLHQTRLRLLVPMLLGMNLLFRDGNEGGYRLLEITKHAGCPIDNRDDVIAHFQTVAKGLANFEGNVLGSPGMSGFDKLTDRLLTLVGRQEVRNRHWEYGVFAATVTTSILFWWIAPPAAMMAFEALFTTAPAFMATKTFAFALTVATMTVEGQVYNSVGDKLIPPTLPTNNASSIPDWADQMQGYETLLESDFNSPDYYLEYMGSIQAQLASIYEPWLLRNVKTLQSALQAERRDLP